MHGVLVVNLGSPEDLRVSRVSKYLNNFLTDHRVIDLPWIIRQILVRCIITPTRVFKSRAAYRKIWQNGSPLIQNSQKFADLLQKELGRRYKIELCMRYGEPSIERALERLIGCDKLTIFPLYPQYANSSTGTAIAKILELIINSWRIPELNIIRDYYNDIRYIKALRNNLQQHVSNFKPDHVLLSYHGLPVRHLEKEGCTNICAQQSVECGINFRSNCYRGQCYATSRAITKDLAVPHTTVFQSRLGKLPWCKPYLTEILPRLYNSGVRKLAIICPSFTMDCLETLEEINIGIRKEWLSMPDTEFQIIPCLNDSIDWIKAASQIVLGENELQAVQQGSIDRTA